jgi:hypothetical protein
MRSSFFTFYFLLEHLRLPELAEINLAARFAFQQL